MSDHVYIAKDPTHVPKTWLLGLIGISISFAVYAFNWGSWKNNMETRAQNIELRQDQLAEAFRLLQLQQGEKIDLLLQRTSRIEGQNELILKRMR